MKYQVQNQGSLDLLTGEELLHQLLKQRGVADPTLLLKLNESVIHPASLFKNIEQAANLLGRHLYHRSKIGILIDCDLDGYGSASIIYRFIKDLIGMECLYLTHQGKRHGLYEEILEEIQALNLDLLIVPDGGVNDVEACETLKAQGTDVLILDHHLIERDNPAAVVVSSADDVYPNPTLVGGAVVYRFCQYVRDYYHLDLDLKPYLPIVALTLISDMADLRNPESRFFTLKGLELFHLNPFLHEIATQKKLYQADQSVTIQSVSWSIAPMLNATIRNGEMEDKLRLFKALVGVEEQVPYKARKSKANPNPKEELISLQAFMLKRCETIKRQQDNQVKKGVAKIEETIEAQDLLKHKVLVVDVSEDLSSAYTGLVANKLADKYKRGCLLLRRKDKDQGLYGGSGRGYSKAAGMEDFRQFLLDSGQFESISGHSKAFGFNLPASNVEQVLHYADEALKDVEIEDVYHVDYELKRSQIDKALVEKVGQFQHLWGSTLPEPLFAITDIEVTADQVQLLGERRNVIRILSKQRQDELAFMKFFTNEARYLDIIKQPTTGFSIKKDQRLKLTVIGKFKISDYNGGTPQVEIVEIVSEPLAARSLF